MSLGEEFISAINRNGTTSKAVAEYLEKIETKVDDTEKASSIRRLRNTYSNLYEYFEPSQSVLKNLEKRLCSLKPFLIETLEKSSESDSRVIKALLENYSVLKFYASKTFWERVQLSFKNSLNIPIENKENKESE